MNSNDHLLAQVKESVLYLTLNNENKRNPISDLVIDGIVQNLEWAKLNDDIKVVVINSTGSVFSAGGDIKAMRDKTGMFAGDSLELMTRYQHGIQKIPLAIESFNKPIIASVQGACVGAGADLTFMCDLRIAGKSASFSESFGKLALVPGDGGTFFLSRILGYAKALELALTGRKIKSDEALAMGLVSELVEDKNLEARTHTLALELALMPNHTLQMIKKAMKALFTAKLDDHLTLLSAFQGITQRSIQHESIVEGFLKK